MKKAEDIFDSILKRVQEGEDIESCLRDYPQLADELRPLLRIAATIEDLPKPEPDRDAVERTVARVCREIQGRATERKFSFKNLYTLHPGIIRTAVAMLFICVLAVTTVRVSADSLPGNPLYSVKLLSEKVRYAITFRDENKAELHIVFAERRTDEFETTFKQGEKINRTLLMAMLEETNQAVEKSQNLQDENVVRIRQMIKECSGRQLAVLESIKPRACPCDMDTLRAAIDACNELRHCLDCDPASCNNPDCPHSK